MADVTNLPLFQRHSCCVSTDGRRLDALLGSGHMPLAGVQLHEAGFMTHIWVRALGIARSLGT